MQPPDLPIKLVVEATVSPSEDAEKVARALGNVVGVAPEAVSFAHGRARLVTADKKAIEHVRDQLRDRHVRPAARRQMLLNRAGFSTSMMLNRQAAAAGVVAVCASPQESPLGPIFLKLTSEKLDAALDWLTAYAAE